MVGETVQSPNRKRKHTEEANSVSGVCLTVVNIELSAWIGSRW